MFSDAAASFFRELNAKVATLERSCNGGYIRISPAKRVNDFVGGTIKEVRVIRSAPPEWLRGNKPEDLLKKALEGEFNSASCAVDWDELTFWSVEGTIRFEDGRQSAIITDGWHVAVQDQDGKGWFLRILPAAQ